MLRKGTDNCAIVQIQVLQLMKRCLSLFFLALGLTFVAKAQVKNYISVWGQAGESSLMTNISQLSSNLSFGGAGGVGFGYELEANHFLFTIGLSADVSHTVFSSKPLQQEIPGAIDDEGDKLTFVYDQHSRSDAYTNISAQIPLMVGAAVNRFYFLAGVKAEINLLTFANSKAVLSSSGDYEKFIDPFTGMPEHMFFGETPITTSNRPKFGPNVLLSLEIGGRFGQFNSKDKGFDVPQTRNYGRLAVFADFGLLDIHQKGSDDPIKLPTTFNSEDMQSSIRLTDLLSSSAAENAVRSLTIGLKYTYLFRLPDKKACVICKD